MKKSGSRWILTGGIFAGLAASLCCIGPLLSLSLGLGSFAASTWFAAWRPMLLALTFVLLGMAWWQTYRPPKTDCADGTCSRPPRKGARVVLWLGTLAALGSAAYPSLPTAQRRVESIAVAAGDTTLTVLIPSMDCPACAAGIETSLSREQGVIQAAVNYDTKAADVIFDPAVTTRERLLALIDASGFSADRSTVK